MSLLHDAIPWGGFVDIRVLTLTFNSPKPIQLHYIVRPPPLHAFDNKTIPEPQFLFLLREIDLKLIRSTPDDAFSLCTDQIRGLDNNNTNNTTTTNNNNNSNNGNNASRVNLHCESRDEQTIRTVINDQLKHHQWARSEEIKALKFIGLLPLRSPKSSLISPQSVISLLHLFGHSLKAILFEAALVSLLSEQRMLYLLITALKHHCFRISAQYNLPHHYKISYTLLKNLITKDKSYPSVYQPVVLSHYMDYFKQKLLQQYRRENNNNNNTNTNSTNNIHKTPNQQIIPGAYHYGPSNDDETDHLLYHIANNKTVLALPILDLRSSYLISYLLSLPRFESLVNVVDYKTTGQFVLSPANVKVNGTISSSSSFSPTTQQNNESSSIIHNNNHDNLMMVNNTTSPINTSHYQHASPAVKYKPSKSKKKLIPAQHQQQQQQQQQSSALVSLSQTTDITELTEQLQHMEIESTHQQTDTHTNVTLSYKTYNKYVNLRDLAISQSRNNNNNNNNTTAITNTQRTLIATQPHNQQQLTEHTHKKPQTLHFSASSKKTLGLTEYCDLTPGANPLVSAGSTAAQRSTKMGQLPVTYNLMNFTFPRFNTTTDNDNSNNNNTSSTTSTTTTSTITGSGKGKGKAKGKKATTSSTSTTTTSSSSTTTTSSINANTLVSLGGVGGMNLLNFHQYVNDYNTQKQMLFNIIATKKQHAAQNGKNKQLQPISLSNNNSHNTNNSLTTPNITTNKRRGASATSTTTTVNNNNNMHMTDDISTTPSYPHTSLSSSSSSTNATSTQPTTNPLSTELSSNAVYHLNYFNLYHTDIPHFQFYYKPTTIPQIALSLNPQTPTVECLPSWCTSTDYPVSAIEEARRSIILPIDLWAMSFGDKSASNNNNDNNNNNNNNDGNESNNNMTNDQRPTNQNNTITTTTSTSVHTIPPIVINTGDFIEFNTAPLNTGKFHHEFDSSLSTTTQITGRQPRKTAAQLEKERLYEEEQRRAAALAKQQQQEQEEQQQQQQNEQQENRPRLSPLDLAYHRILRGQLYNTQKHLYWALHVNNWDELKRLTLHITNLFFDYSADTQVLCEHCLSNCSVQDRSNPQFEPSRRQRWEALQYAKQLNDSVNSSNAAITTTTTTITTTTGGNNHNNTNTPGYPSMTGGKQHYYGQHATSGDDKNTTNTQQQQQNDDPFRPHRPFHHGGGNRPHGPRRPRVTKYTTKCVCKCHFLGHSKQFRQYFSQFVQNVDGTTSHDLLLVDQQDILDMWHRRGHRGGPGRRHHMRQAEGTVIEDRQTAAWVRFGHRAFNDTTQHSSFSTSSPASQEQQQQQHQQSQNQNSAEITTTSQLQQQPSHHHDVQQQQPEVIQHQSQQEQQQLRTLATTTTTTTNETTRDKNNMMNDEDVVISINTNQSPAQQQQQTTPLQNNTTSPPQGHQGAPGGGGGGGKPFEHPHNNHDYGLKDLTHIVPFSLIHAIALKYLLYQDNTTQNHQNSPLANPSAVINMMNTLCGVIKQPLVVTSSLMEFDEITNLSFFAQDLKPFFREPGTTEASQEEHAALFATQKKPTTKKKATKKTKADTTPAIPTDAMAMVMMIDEQDNIEDLDNGDVVNSNNNSATTNTTTNNGPVVINKDPTFPYLFVSGDLSHLDILQQQKQNQRQQYYAALVEWEVDNDPMGDYEHETISDIFKMQYQHEFATTLNNPRFFDEYRGKYRTAVPKSILNSVGKNNSTTPNIDTSTTTATTTAIPTTTTSQPTSSSTPITTTDSTPLTIVQIINQHRKTLEEQQLVSTGNDISNNTTNHLNSIHSTSNPQETPFIYEITAETLPFFRALLFHIEQLTSKRKHRLLRHCNKLLTYTNQDIDDFISLSDLSLIEGEGLDGRLVMSKPTKRKVAAVMTKKEKLAAEKAKLAAAAAAAVADDDEENTNPVTTQPTKKRGRATQTASIIGDDNDDDDGGDDKTTTRSQRQVKRQLLNHNEGKQDLSFDPTHYDEDNTSNNNNHHAAQSSIDDVDNEQDYYLRQDNFAHIYNDKTTRVELDYNQLLSSFASPDDPNNFANNSNSNEHLFSYPDTTYQYHQHQPQLVYTDPTLVQFDQQQQQQLQQQQQPQSGVLYHDSRNDATNLTTTTTTTTAQHVMNNINTTNPLNFGGFAAMLFGQQHQNMYTYHEQQNSQDYEPSSSNTPSSSHHYHQQQQQHQHYAPDYLTPNSSQFTEYQPHHSIMSNGTVDASETTETTAKNNNNTHTTNNNDLILPPPTHNHHMNYNDGGNNPYQNTQHVASPSIIQPTSGLVWGSSLTQYQHTTTMNNNNNNDDNGAFMSDTNNLLNSHSEKQEQHPPTNPTSYSTLQQPHFGIHSTIMSNQHYASLQSTDPNHYSQQHHPLHHQHHQQSLSPHALGSYTSMTLMGYDNTQQNVTQNITATTTTQQPPTISTDSDFVNYFDYFSPRANHGEKQNRQF